MSRGQRDADHGPGQALRIHVGALQSFAGEIRDTEALYIKVAAERDAGRQTFKLHREFLHRCRRLLQAARPRLGACRLSSTVKSNASAAQEVSASSENTAEVPSRVGQALCELDASIQAINQSSSKVTDIIQVIEGIAFQTNILALNAAVEAARAGDQGRGFAVVATEVRMLAQRSAQAAKEIRELLGTSARHATDGVARMGHARATIDEALVSVTRVGALIRQIANATHEQAIGIARVDEAITHLDGVTQQNAAVASLHQRSATLERSVDVFRMD